MATAWAALRGAPLAEICAAASRSAPREFSQPTGSMWQPWHHWALPPSQLRGVERMLCSQFQCEDRGDGRSEVVMDCKL